MGKRGYFAATTDDGKPSFSIQLPPPNVTGTLHMGHAFNQTIMDGLTRYYRMRGFNTAWIPGTDHAGIATQIVVERQLDAQKSRAMTSAAKSLRRKGLGVEGKIRLTITNQMRRLGASIDWNREYFTMDEQNVGRRDRSVRAPVEQGLIYRGKRLVNWDPVLGTAVSDLEVVSEEEDGSHVAHPVPAGGRQRPPDGRHHAPGNHAGRRRRGGRPDRRALHAPGRQDAQAAAVGREIPIIADEYVDKEFGTGCVKITPAHDFNDYAVGQRHKLPMIRRS
jgi:valyl-tRNA synthetase